MPGLGRALLLATLVVPGCSSGTEPVDDVPGGVAVTLNGVVVARAVGSSVEGGIHVHFGEYSGLFEVEVLNGGGEAIPAGSGLRLEASVPDVGLATFVQATPGAFRGEFEMYGDGTTSITFRLVRAATGAVAWTSVPVDLVVLAC